jgi:hypothetical protein
MEIAVKKGEERDNDQTDHKAIVTRDEGDVINPLVFGVVDDIECNKNKSGKDDEKRRSFKKRTSDDPVQDEQHQCQSDV